MTSPTEAPLPAVWRRDILPGYSCTDIPLSPDLLVPGETATSIGAVLVRRDPDDPSLAPAETAVLYLHGWNDYFFQTHLGDYWAGMGMAFYALDLRRYGRALRPGQFLCYIADLHDYATEIDMALKIILAAGHRRVILMGHSTGGLTASLYADAHPAAIVGLVLNSPWLDLQGTALLRNVTAPLLAGMGRMLPTTPLPPADNGFYRRTIHRDEDGEWDYDLRWKGGAEALIRLGWGRAILQAHQEVAAGLDIHAPVLVACSDRSYVGSAWDPQMTRSDIVLDVERIVRRAVDLGPVVTVVRIEGGLHDLVLSPKPVREAFFAAVTTWVHGYCDV